MNNLDNAGKRLKLLVIHALGCRPDESAFTKLLKDAGLGGSDVEFVVPADVVNKSIVLQGFDCILAILTDELELDENLEDFELAVVKCEMGVTGIWGEDVVNNEMHPAVRKYGIQQIPWSPAKLREAITFNIRQRFQSSYGGPAAHHEIKHNKC